VNKLFVFFCFILFLPFCFSLKAIPFVSFPGEKVLLEFDSKVSVEMSYYYNLNEVKECSKSNCPLFENNSLKDSGKKTFVLNTMNVKPGFYAVKVFEDDSNEFYFTSVVVRPDYRILIGLAIFVLIVLGFFVVKRNV